MVQIIILAGGMGKRMKSELPKVLIHFHYKPMIVHVVSQSLELNPNQILVVVGESTGSLIRETLHKWFPNETRIQYVLQQNPQGTGHAVQCCLPYLQEDKETLILSGDVPNVRAKTLKTYFELNNRNATISGKLLAFTPSNNNGYGRVIEDEGSLLYICEEKDCNESLKEVKLCNTGIYCIDSAFIKNYIGNIENNNKSNEYYLPDIFHFILEEYSKSVKVCCLPQNKNNEVAGINTKEQLEELERESLKCIVN